LEGDNVHARQLVVVAVLVAAGVTGCSSSSKSATLHGLSQSQFCDLARKDRAAFNGATIANASPTQVKDLYAKVRSALHQAQSAAPSAIKGDFDTFMTAYNPYLKALAAANYDLTKMTPTATRLLGTAQVRTASAHITQYLQQMCKLNTTPTT
jgi:ABC-type phosphate/phosphonate transport system substrate-binding protein